MAMENKRIIQLSTERTTLGDDDYTIVDSDTNGTAKYRLSRLKETDTTLSVSGMAADAAATGQAINAETQARTQAVAAETQARQQAISAESQVRAAADTTLGNDVQDLKSAMKLLCEEIPNTVQTYVFADGSVSQVLHKSGNTTVRTDTFTYATNTITEVRTLNTGESLTIVTNLQTLETVVTYATA